VPSSGLFIGPLPVPDDESAVPNELVGATDWSSRQPADPPGRRSIWTSPTPRPNSSQKTTPEEDSLAERSTVGQDDAAPPR
jgi:hypothetical protein